MSKKRELSYLREQIMIDVQDLNLLLNLITSYRVESLTEAVILTRLALAKGKKISRFNEQIGMLLNL